MKLLLNICLFTFLGILHVCVGMQPNIVQQVVLAHKKRSADDLFAVIPATLSPKPLVHLTALLEQTDTFSCVYRSLFHAQCITLAMQEVTRGDSFEKNLKQLLQNEELLNRTFTFVKEYLDKHDPTHDKTTGLCINHLLGVCAASIPLLHTKILPLLLEDDKKIYAVYDPTPLLPSPLHYSTDFVKNYCTTKFPLTTCRKELDASAGLAHQLEQLKGPHRVAHFACRFPKHMFIASIITDGNGYAKLYVIDSNNNNLAHEKFNPFASKIGTYADAHNKSLDDTMRKKQKTIPLIKGHS